MNNELILNRIMEVKGFQKPAELARFLEIKQNVLSHWYHNRNKINFDIIFTKCEDINLNWLIYGEGEIFKKGYVYDRKLYLLNDPDTPYKKSPSFPNNQSNVLFEQLRKKDEQIAELLSIIKEKS